LVTTGTVRRTRFSARDAQSVRFCQRVLVTAQHPASLAGVMALQPDDAGRIYFDPPNRPALIF
jgi:hypothetical protein